MHSESFLEPRALCTGVFCTIRNGSLSKQTAIFPVPRATGRNFINAPAQALKNIRSKPPGPVQNPFVFGLKANRSALYFDRQNRSRHYAPSLSGKSVPRFLRRRSLCEPSALNKGLEQTRLHRHAPQGPVWRVAWKHARTCRRRPQAQLQRKNHCMFFPSSRFRILPYWSR